MSIEGSVSVSVDFNDLYSAASLDALKKIRLATNAAYTAGQVVVLSGTCSTTAATFDFLSPPYTASDGSAVTFTGEGAVYGVAVYSDAKVTLTVAPTATGTISPTGRSMKLSSNGNVATSAVPGSGATLGGSTCSIFVDSSVAATANYTVVMWGQ